MYTVMKAIRPIIACLSILAISLAPLHVQASSSQNYTIEEDFVGGGGRVESSSTNFTAQDSLGAVGVGESAGTLYGQIAGATTTNDPTLTFIVDNATVNLGSLSTSLTRSGTATFRVLNYTSYGYLVQIIGDPPDNGGHTLSDLSSATASTTGTEQFGINLKNNATPDVGADPVQVPDSSFSFGAAASGYNTADLFKYVSGDTIATADQSSGRTDYTISYIANISTNTPGGSYSGGQTLVVVGTY
jgi:hypothetical protein